MKKYFACFWIASLLGILAFVAVRELRRNHTGSGVRNSDPMDLGVSPSLSPVAGVSKWNDLCDASLSVEARLGLARTIHPGLTGGDVSELFRLMSRVPSHADRANSYLVANEVMEQMRKQGVGSEEYSGCLISICRNEQVDPVLRDYAIQHLSQWIAPAPPGITPGETDGKKRDEGIRVILSCIMDPDLAKTSIPGTSVMALCDALPRLGDETAGFIWGHLKDYAETTLVTPHSHAATKAAVIHMAAQLRKTELVPYIRHLATSDGVEPGVRLSAIHALGELRSTEDVAFLRVVASTDNPFLPAARAALRRISEDSSH